MDLIRNDMVQSKLEAYLQLFQTMVSRIQGKLQLSAKDTPYESKYPDREKEKQAKTLCEYEVFIREHCPKLYEELLGRELVTMIGDYRELSDGDRVRLLKAILKLHRVNQA